MNSRRRLSTIASALLVGAIALMSASAAIASCAFTLTATPSAVAPEGAVALKAACLHDAFGNPISGETVDFQIKSPSNAATNVTGPATDANGDSQVSFTQTVEYGTYTATATRGAASASTTFTAKPGPASGALTLTTPAAAQVGTSAQIAIAAIKDAGGFPVANGTEVTFTVTGPSDFSKTLTATVAGVTGTSTPAAVSATIAGTDLKKAGEYSVAATADDATGSGAFQLLSGPLASLNTDAPAALIVGSAGTFSVNDAVDANANPVSAAAVALTIKPKVGTGSNSLGTLTTDASGQASGPFSVDPTLAYGRYVATATSGAATASDEFDFNAGPAATIGSVTANPASVSAGTDVSLTVNDIVSSGGHAVANGTPVAFSVSRSATEVFSGTTPSTGGTSSVDPASASIVVPAESNTGTGTYSVSVTVGSATNTTTYAVTAGVPAADLTVTASDVDAGKTNSVVVTGVPSTASSAKLVVARPDGTKVTKNATPSNGKATFSLTAAELNQVGAYGASATTKNTLGQIDGGGSGNFSVRHVTFTVTAPNVLISTANSAKIALGPGAAQVSLTISRPDGSSFVRTGSLSGGNGNVAIPAADLNQAGLYGITGVAKNGTNVVGSGTGSFTVTEIDSISVVAGTPTVLPAGAQRLTATVLDTLGAGAPNQTVTFSVVHNFSTREVATGSPKTDASGKAILNLGSTQTLLPGTYTVSVREPVSGVSSETTFEVIAAS